MTTPSHWSKARSVAERVGPILAVVAIVVVGFFGSEWLMRDEAPSAERERFVNAAGEDGLPQASLVRLTPEKIESAAIATARVEMR